MYRNEDGMSRGDVPHEEIPRDEMLLDICLEEVLSGQAPPDLSARILAAASSQGVSSQGTPVAPPLAEPPLVSAASEQAMPVAPPVQSHSNGHVAGVSAAPTPVVHTRPSQRRQAQATGAKSWAGLAVAAGLLAVALGLGIAALRWGQDETGPHVAGVDEKPPNEVGENPAGVDRRQQQQRDPHSEQLAANPFSETLFGAEFPPLAGESPVPWDLPYAVERKASAEVVNFVNDHIAAGGPGRSVDDDRFSRRVFQQILGRQPTSEELVDFATSDAIAKREKLVDRLLTAEKYQAEFASHWASVLSDQLLGPASSDAGEASEHREDLQQYLAGAIRNHTPQDELVSQLISATGDADPGNANYNGAVNFILAGAQQGKPSNNNAQLAATVGRVFLGHQGQCAQCHDDNRPGGLTQQQFWQLAAFFQQTDAADSQLANSDFVGPSGDSLEAELFYRSADGQRRIAYPVFVDGTPINPNGRANVVNRRAELAKLIVQSEDFSASMVNRYWQQLLKSPVDSAASSRDREALLQGLSEQFAAHGFDHRKLIRWIVLSDANGQDFVDSPAPLYENVAAALQDVGHQGRPVGMTGSVMFARVDSGASGDQGAGDIFVPTQGAEAETSSNGFVKRIAASDMSVAAKIEHIFQEALARRPTRNELAAAQRMITSQPGQTAAALDDIWWAITNSAEYRGG